MRHSIRITCILSALALTACGSTATDATGTTPVQTVATTGEPETTAVGDGAGWLDGEPEWHGGGSSTATDAAASADESMGRESLAEAPASAWEEGSDSEATGEVADRTLEPTNGSPLRAGSVDDNDAFAEYLDYLARIRSLGIPLRDFDPTGRIVATVIGSNGLPIVGAEVTVSANGAEVAKVRTTADGTVRFHPVAYGQPVDATYTFVADGVSVDAPAGGTAELTVTRPGGAQGAVPLDVLFLLDATGSMGDEIARLKTSIDRVAERVDALAANPDARFAMTLYRDEGDAFVTTTFDFTADVEAFRAALADAVADGGGDYPEALDEGLAAALAEPAWRDPADAVQLVFLVADAPPQVGRQVAKAYPESITDAIARGVKIFPVASSESDDQAEAVFRQLAQATGARFVFLSYGAGGAATGETTDIQSTDYEELALDDLIVRLIAEELAHLTGDISEVPVPTPQPTTIPPEQ